LVSFGAKRALHGKADKLRPPPYTGFAKNLLKRGLNGAFRDAHFSGNFLVA
jgi:hypothetical protein